MSATRSSPRPGQALLDEGRLAESRVEFWREAGDAEADGDAVALAAAALGLGGLWVHEHRSTVERARVRALQRRALAALEPDDPLAARLRIRLAGEDAYVAGDPSAILAEVDAARGNGDPVALAEALSIAHHCLLGPAHGATRLALADELIEVATRSGRPVDEVMGLAWRTIDLFLAGDRRAARSLRELRDRLAVQRCDALAFVVAAIDVTVAMRAGDLAEAERLAEVCFAVGVEAGDADAEGWFGGQLLVDPLAAGSQRRAARPRPWARRRADGRRVQRRLRRGDGQRRGRGRRDRSRSPCARRTARPRPDPLRRGELLADHARRGGRRGQDAGRRRARRRGGDRSSHPMPTCR